MTAKKPVERRQRGARTRDVGTVVALSPSESEPAAARASLHWCVEVAEGWAELWSSPLAGQIKATDLPALRRLFDFRHQLADAQARSRAEPLVVGSTGQPVLSPFAAEVHRLEGAIGKLEDRFGLTPLARLRLGVTLEEGKSLVSRNAALLAEWKAKAGG
jgi:hypothetical protein